MELVTVNILWWFRKLKALKICELAPIYIVKLHDSGNIAVLGLLRSVEHSNSHSGVLL
jgi:hypothetical protein